MSRVCQITGRRPTSGQNRPFSLKATKRTFRPNLFVKRMFNPLTGKIEKMKLSAKAIKTLKRWAAESGTTGNTLVNTVSKKTGITHTAGEGKHLKKLKLTPKQKKELEAEKAKQLEESHKSKIDKSLEATE